MSLITHLLHAGIKHDTPEHHRRAIVISNTIACISALLGLIFEVFAGWNGWGRLEWITLGAIVAIGTVPALNFFGFIDLSRFILPMAMPLVCIIVILLIRMQQAETLEYERNPGAYCIILTTAVIPILVFSTHEKKLMYSSLSILFILFGSLDIIYRYYSKLHALPSVAQYLSSNLTIIIAYVLLVSSAIALKEITEEYEYRNRILIDDLNHQKGELESANRELHELNKNIETQNEEIQAQREQLVQSQERLILAKQEIERQNARLEQQNVLLSKTLDEKSNDLLLTNQQLVAHNNELQQFSYTISHNLRGPVASMLGLINLHAHATSPLEEKKIMDLLEQSTRSLETVIRDLNKIIDIRNDKFSVFESISLEHELGLIKKTLSPYIVSNEASIESAFEVSEITSIKAYINSILYNLISNAIQYRAFDRAPSIKITSKAAPGFTILEVSDNGLGIDLDKFREELFKLYKRFHTHTNGKGIGLYLVKQQVEKLSGRIELESTLNVGSTFRIFLPQKAGT